MVRQVRGRAYRDEERVLRHPGQFLGHLAVHRHREVVQNAVKAQAEIEFLVGESGPGGDVADQEMHADGEFVEADEAGFRQRDHRRGNVEAEGVDPLEAEFTGAQGGAAEPGSGAAAGIEDREGAPPGGRQTHERGIDSPPDFPGRRSLYGPVKSEKTAGVPSA